MLGWQRVAPLAISLLALLAPRIVLGQLGVRPDSAAAQSAPRARLLFRVDGLFARYSALHAGAGAGVAAGTYVRLSLEGGAGVAWTSRAGERTASGRVDLIARFLLDPYAQHSRGPYAGGGVSARHEAGDGWRPGVLVVFGLEGRPRAGWIPALEAGLGRGARIGIVARQGRPGRRP